MPRFDDAPEALVAGHVRRHTSAAVLNLTAALAPLRRRRDRYGKSEMMKQLEEAERLAKMAEKTAKRWAAERTAEPVDLFDQEGES